MSEKTKIANIIFPDSYNLFTSPQTLFVLGIAIALIPFVEIQTDFLTFGRSFGENEAIISSLLHISVYWLFFIVLGEISRRFIPLKSKETEEKNFVADVIKPHRIIFVSIFGAVVILNATNYGEVAYPISIMFLGVFFNIYGRNNSKILEFFSWTYIVIGCLYLWLTLQGIPDLWIYVTGYLGLSFVLISSTLIETQKKSKE